MRRGCCSTEWLARVRSWLVGEAFDQSRALPTSGSRRKVAWRMEYFSLHRGTANNFESISLPTYHGLSSLHRMRTPHTSQPHLTSPPRLVSPSCSMLQLREAPPSTYLGRSSAIHHKSITTYFAPRI